MKTLFACLAGVVVTGCANTPIALDPNYQAYLEAHKQSTVNQKSEIQIFKLKAQPGQTITLGGVEELTINAPTSGGNVAGITPQTYQPRPNEWAPVISQGLSVFGMVGGVWAGGVAARNLATAVGSSANHGYQYVQSPQPNMTISGNGVIGAGSYTSNTMSGTGVLGSGTYSNLGGNGVVGTGTYTAPVDNHTVNPSIITQIPAGQVCTVSATGVLTCI